MSPPDLTGDAPGPDIPEPVEVDARKTVGREADAPLLDRCDRGRGELLHGAPPLEHDQRLDARPAALTGADRVPVRLAALDESALLGPRQHPLSGLLLRQAGQLARFLGHPPVEA